MKRRVVSQEREREKRENARSNKLQRNEKEKKVITTVHVSNPYKYVSRSLPSNPDLRLDDDHLGYSSSTASPLQQSHDLPSSFSSLLGRSDREDGDDDDGWFDLLLSGLSASSEEEGRESGGGGGVGGDGGRGVGVGSGSGEGEGRSG